MRLVPKFLCEDGVFRYPQPDGSVREVCKTDCKKGLDEYIRRRRVAWEEQKHLCSICGKQLFWKDAVTDHFNPRGMGGGSRRDNQENIRAAHWECNQKKASQRQAVPDDILDAI